jgi:chorismate synthase
MVHPITTDFEAIRELNRRKPGQSKTLSTAQRTRYRRILFRNFSWVITELRLIRLVYNTNQKIKRLFAYKDVYRLFMLTAIGDKKYGVRDIEVEGRKLVKQRRVVAVTAKNRC